jgi:histidinol-phosphate aminotransferase
MANLIRQNVLQAAGYIPGEQPTDTVTIKLNTNENPYPPSPRVLEAIGKVTPEQLRRYPNPNARPFREAAAQVHNLPSDWILTFNGGDELLSVIIRACASESDAVAYLEPSYSLYPVLTNVHGAHKLVLPYQITGTVWSFPSEIEKTKATLLLIVNPNAPSGHFNTVSELEKIVQNFRGVVLIDEAYVDFASESALPLVQKYQNLIILRTMSKGYSLAGLRFGYALGQPALLKEIEKVRDSYPCDVVSIAAATAALGDQDYARSTWDKVKSERERVTAALKEMGFSMPQSQSNFLLAELPAKAKRAGSAQHIYESLKERQILVRFWDLPFLTDKVRITIGTPAQNDLLLKELTTLI